MNKEPKIASEMKTRKVFLNLASKIGCEVELRHIFDKYDKILKNCTNESEITHIQALAVNEVNNLLQSYQKLSYNIGQPENVIKELKK
jgi:hypothetical protein